MELAKQWRLDKYLRRLDASFSSACVHQLACEVNPLPILLSYKGSLNTVHVQHLQNAFNLNLTSLQAVMIVADAKESLTITGNGDVVEPHDGVIGAFWPFTTAGLLPCTDAECAGFKCTSNSMGQQMAFLWVQQSVLEVLMRWQQPGPS